MLCVWWHTRTVRHRPIALANEINDKGFVVKTPESQPDTPSPSRLVIWGVATGTYAIALPFVLGPLFVALSDAELATRIALCVASIAPVGVLLGFGFPTGMRLIGAIDPRPTPWFWGINGAAGVLASIVAVILSLALGISTTLVIGALCYFLLIPVSLKLLQPEEVAGAKKTGKVEAPRRSLRSSQARSR